MLEIFQFQQMDRSLLLILFAEDINMKYLMRNRRKDNHKYSNIQRIHKPENNNFKFKDTFE